MPRIPITSIYIVCEGKNTEPLYLERIKEEVEDENYLAITIYPDRSDENHKSDPIGLINEAIDNKSSYDEIWIVYDKDGYTKHKEAFELLNEHSDKIKLVAFITNELLFYSKQSSEIAIPINSAIIIPQNNLSLKFNNHSELYVSFGFNTIYFCFN